jgi:hypothetical protein
VIAGEPIEIVVKTDPGEFGPAAVTEPATGRPSDALAF